MWFGGGHGDDVLLWCLVLFSVSIQVVIPLSASWIEITCPHMKKEPLALLLSRQPTES